MTGNRRAPERRKFPVSARESPKLKMDSYCLSQVETVVKQHRMKRRKGVRKENLIVNGIGVEWSLLFGFKYEMFQMPLRSLRQATPQLIFAAL